MRRTRITRMSFANQDADVQMMETDIMRFLAIIALCLAVIFALVSGASHEIKQQKQTAEVVSKPVTPPTKKRSKPIAEITLVSPAP